MSAVKTKTCEVLKTSQVLDGISEQDRVSVADLAIEIGKSKYWLYKFNKENAVRMIGKKARTPIYSRAEFFAAAENKRAFHASFDNQLARFFCRDLRGFKNLAGLGTESKLMSFDSRGGGDVD